MCISLRLQSGGSRLRSLLVEWIVGVPARFESVKRVPVVSIKRQSEPDAFWQIWIRDEVSSEGDQIRVAVPNSNLGSVRLKTSCCNDLPRENLSQPRRRYGPLAVGDEHVPLDAWFDDVQVCESKVIQLLCYIVEQRNRIAIRNSIPSSTR